MLKYSVKIRKDTTSYTGHIDSGDKKVSAQEMYTEMQNNSIKKYFTAQKWIFGILGFVMSYIGDGDDDFFICNMLHSCLYLLLEREKSTKDKYKF